jgi:hypothetical protein
LAEAFFRVAFFLIGFLGERFFFFANFLAAVFVALRVRPVVLAFVVRFLGTVLFLAMSEVYHCGVELNLHALLQR